MPQSDHRPLKSDSDDFARQADGKQESIVGEFFSFMRETRKWFLAPIVILLLIVGLIVVLGGTVAAPFIYTLF
ncbi:MAG: hypothetical protein FJ197_11865 [Gammaproteobacteria bacterium]|nr:hypothetical protein [Gammaproteobacteria bacterium]